MAPPPHPFRVLDFYRIAAVESESKEDELGVAWNASEGRYMRAVDLDDAPRAINMESVEDYLKWRFGKGKDKDAAKEIARFWTSLGFVQPEDALWPLPDKPEMPLKEWEANSETGSLLTDLSTWFGEHVRLPSEASAVSVATWVLRSWVPETARHAPPLLFFGMMGSGKTRAIDALSLVARKAMHLSAPSAASLYAVIDHYQPAVVIDEWANVAPEIRRAVEGLMRIGFDPGGRIPRRKEHSEDVKFWRASAFYAAASRMPIADDVVDRALPVYMTESREAVPDLPSDDPTARDLRTACLRYRLEVLAGTCHRQPVADARSRVLETLVSNPVVRLSGRGLDKAESLAAVAIPFDALDDTMETVLAAAREGGLMFQYTAEAYVYRAIRELAQRRPAVDGRIAISLGEVHRLVWEDYMMEGVSQRTLEMHDPVLPEKLGPLVRTMPFLTARRKDGNYIVDSPEGLQARLDAMSAKYGE